MITQSGHDNDMMRMSGWWCHDDNILTLFTSSAAAEAGHHTGPRGRTLDSLPWSANLAWAAEI